MAEQTQTRRIIVKVDVKGDASIKNLHQSFTQLNTTMQKSSNTLLSLSNMFKGLFAASLFGKGIGDLVGVADSMQKLNDRLVVTEGSSEKAAIALRDLGQLANATNLDVKNLTGVYTRLQMALGDTGLSSKALMGLTTTLTQTFRISGATAEEMNSAMIQLSQGLSSGQLRGQELRSVLEANSVIGDILAKKFGIMRGELLRFSEKRGGLSAPEVLQALAEAADDLNKRASSLTPTIGESMTKAFNNLKISANELNKEFGISKVVGEGILLISNNLGKLTIALTAFIAAANYSYIISGLATSFVALQKATSWILITGAVLASPLYALQVAATAAGLAIAGLVGYLGFGEQISSKFSEWMTKIKISFMDFKTPVEAFKDQAKDLIGVIKGDGLLTNGKSVADDILAMGNASKFAASPLQAVSDQFKKEASNLKAAIKEKIDYKKQLTELNQKFNDGEISVLKYNQELYRLTDILSGAKGPKKHWKEMNDVLRDNLNRELEYGIITMRSYQSQMESMNLKQIEEGFKKGYMSAYEYHKKLVEIGNEFRPGSALYVGTQQYLDNIGTVSKQVADAITSTFSRLEDSLVSFVRKGTFEFAKFTEAVLDDLARIIIRASIIQPLAQGVLNFAATPNANANLGTGQNLGAGTTGDAGTRLAANGFAPNGSGVTMFANGGIVSSPTAFTYGGSKTGIMGEAGHEAIMPLTRGSNGKLGVEASQAPVVININNESDAQIQQTESTGPDGKKQIEILITNTVKNGLANGFYDRQLKSSYGLNRRGN